MDEEKKYNSNKTPKISKKAEYMKFTEEEEDDDDAVSSSEKKDTFNINNSDSTYSNYSEYVSKNGNKINLSGKDLSGEPSQILLNNLYKKFPNATEIDINNCNLEVFPKILLNFKKLVSFDLRNNNFLDFESLAESLSTYNNLTDLKVDLVDQNQVLLILSQIPKLIFLNGKSTKEAVTIVDVDEKDIQDISLQNEVESFNDIINKLNEREEQLNIKNNQESNKDDDNNESSISIFSTEFQNKLYEEAEKIKNYLNNNLPNYMYANYVIQSQLVLKKLLAKKFLAFLQKEDQNIADIILESIFKTGERLVQLLSCLYPKIEEKTESLRNQLEEAWKIADETTDYEVKYKQARKERDIMAANLDIFKLKYKKMEEENNIMSKKIMNLSKEIEEKIDNENVNSLNKNKENIPNNKISIPSKKKENSSSSKDFDKESKIYLSKNINNSNYSLSNNYDNNLYQNNNINLTKSEENKDEVFKSKFKLISLKNMKDLIREIYNSKAMFDKKCLENGKTRETLEQHMYTFLNQKYGLKNLIIEWASSIINAIKLYGSEDVEIYLFGKILRNELDEDSRLIYIKLQENISQLLEYYLKSKNPLKSQAEIKKMLNEKKNGILTEEEWKGIIYYIYNEEEVKILEKKIVSFIQKNKLKNSESIPFNTISEIMQTYNSGNNNYLLSGTNSKVKDNNSSNTYLETHGPKKITRREMFDLFQFTEDIHIFYKHFINVVGEYQIKLREKYLKNFVKLFRKFDTDFDGILNENEFINLIKDIPYCQNNINEFIFKFLSTIDPFDNKVFTFNDCISLFSMEIIEENDNKENQETNENNDNINEKENKDLDNINKENTINDIGNKVEYDEKNKFNRNRYEFSLLDKICGKTDNNQ